MSIRIRTKVDLQGATFERFSVAPDAFATEADFQRPGITDEIIRDFHSPYLELIRLATEAAQIEHALMLQYLFAAFSIKPTYSLLVGWGNPNADDLLGVAVQEMQHLGYVNRMLAELEASPHLNRQDFPYEPDIYPFVMELAPLSLRTLAKYIYTEAPPGVLDPNSGSESPDFLKKLYAHLETEVKPNHLGSLYSALIELAGNVSSIPSGTPFASSKWVARLTQIKDQGEDDHYKFFKSVFLGTHFAFNGNQTVWDDPTSQDYPSLPLPANPSAYEGHENEIPFPEARSIAWLSNIQYWIILVLLALTFLEQNSVFLDRAKKHMTGPLKRLGDLLRDRNVGMPFDHLSAGYYLGSTAATTRGILILLVEESRQVTASLSAANLLPADYPAFLDEQTINTLRA